MDNPLLQTTLDLFWISKRLHISFQNKQGFATKIASKNILIPVTLMSLVSTKARAAACLEKQKIAPLTVCNNRQNAVENSILFTCALSSYPTTLFFITSFRAKSQLWF